MKEQHSTAQIYSIFAHSFSCEWHSDYAVCKYSSVTCLWVSQFVIEPGFFFCGVETKGTAMGSCCARGAPDLNVLSDTHLPLPLPPNPQSCACVCVYTHHWGKQQQELMFSRLKVGPKESNMRAMGEGRSTMSQWTNCCWNSLLQVLVVFIKFGYRLTWSKVP